MIIAYDIAGKRQKRTGTQLSQTQERASHYHSRLPCVGQGECARETRHQQPVQARVQLMPTHQNPAATHGSPHMRGGGGIRALEGSGAWTLLEKEMGTKPRRISIVARNLG